jgi:hypothetical protein
MKNAGLLLGLGAGAIATYFLMRYKDQGPFRLPYVRGDVLFTELQGYVTITDVYIDADVQMYAFKEGIYPDTTYQSANCQTISAGDIQDAGWAFEYNVALPDGEHCAMPA